MTGTKSQHCDIKTMCYLFKYTLAAVYIVCSMHTNICLDLCDPKRSRPDGAPFGFTDSLLQVWHPSD